MFKPPSGNLTLTKVPFSKNATVQMLGSAAKISWEPSPQGTEIVFPPGLAHAGRYAWVLKVQN